MASLAIASSTKTGQLKLILEAHRTQLQLGEPLYLTARLRNVGRTWATVDPALSPESHRVVVDFTDATGESRRFLPLFYADVTIPSRRLAPGEEVAAVFPVFFGSLGWSVSRPGTVQVQIAMEGSDGDELTVSNALVLDVSGGSPLAEALVDGSETSLEAGKFLLWHQGDHLTQGRRTLETLVREDERSILADYARLALGRNLARSFRDYTRSQVRESDCLAALDWLHAVRVDLLPPYLQIQHSHSMADCHAKLGDEDAADKYQRRAKRLADGRPEFDWIMGRIHR